MKIKKVVLHRFFFQQRGVTLIELMISMVLGLLILVGVVYVFSGTRKTYDYNEIMSRVQENGRFATNVLNTDLRMTGYFGCGSVGGYVHRGDNGFFVPDELFPGNAFKDVNFSDVTVGGGVGTGAATGPSAVIGVPLIGTDTLTVTRTSGFRVVSQNPAGMITVAAGSDISLVAPESIMVISNCKTANVFKVATRDVIGLTITPDASTITTDRFGPEANVMTSTRNQYSVGITGRNDRSGVPVRALFRSGVELVEGVEDMRISYGVDNDLDGNVDAYQAMTAGMAWDKVIAIRVDLLVASEEGVLTQAQPYTYAGVTSTPSDRKMRQVFSTTVALRNRIH